MEGDSCLEILVRRFPTPLCVIYPPHDDSWWTKLTDEYQTTFGQDAEFREDVDTLKSAAADIEDRDLLDEEEVNDDEEPEEAVQEEETKEVEEDEEENADDIEMLLPDDDDTEVEEQAVRRSARSNFGHVGGERTFSVKSMTMRMSSMPIGRTPRKGVCPNIFCPKLF